MSRDINLCAERPPDPTTDGPPDSETARLGVPGRSAKGATKPQQQDERSAENRRRELAEQLRRRREAADRLPPLNTGKRDPLQWSARDGRSAR